MSTRQRTSYFDQNVARLWKGLAPPDCFMNQFWLFYFELLLSLAFETMSIMQCGCPILPWQHMSALSSLFTMSNAMAVVSFFDLTFHKLSVRQHFYEMCDSHFEHIKNFYKSMFKWWDDHFSKSEFIFNCFYLFEHSTCFYRVSIVKWDTFNRWRATQVWFTTFEFSVLDGGTWRFAVVATTTPQPIVPLDCDMYSWSNWGVTWGFPPWSGQWSIICHLKHRISHFIWIHNTIRLIDNALWKLSSYFHFNFINIITKACFYLASKNGNKYFLSLILFWFWGLFRCLLHFLMVLGV